MVGIVMPYSVPCPPGAVTSVPADRRSARPVALPSFCSARIEAANEASVNMSSSVVTPKTAAWRRWSAENACVWPSKKPGRSVFPAPSTTFAPSGLYVRPNLADDSIVNRDSGGTDHFVAIEDPHVSERDISVGSDPRAKHNEHHEECSETPADGTHGSHSLLETALQSPSISSSRAS